MGARRPFWAHAAQGLGGFATRPVRISILSTRLSQWGGRRTLANTRSRRRAHQGRARPFSSAGASASAASPLRGRFWRHHLSPPIWLGRQARTGSVTRGPKTSLWASGRGPQVEVRTLPPTSRRCTIRPRGRRSRAEEKPTEGMATSPDATASWASAIRNGCWTGASRHTRAAAGSALPRPWRGSARGH